MSLITESGRVCGAVEGSNVRHLAKSVYKATQREMRIRASKRVFITPQGVQKCLDSEHF